ncbi:lipoprotein signal peptidase [Pontibacter sp. SGAir0037]|uniref:lipoprotein signal peptidase n=1 Tax=Pontibacter sp. SGAir0037 TaxID=2571030 RepID=UPI0010CD20B3|nr:lipoprotein signal peptidase [Pontibacter sp. SGAir0037]QCR24001.1 lipoprotein signal peptidase [Pontibacter sp. SGAir0037]
MKYWKYYLISVLVILIDQAVKLAVHYNMYPGEPGEIVLLGDWLKLHYTTNPGMAFGVELGSDYGKLVLTLFRLVATFGIGYYLYYLARHKAAIGLIWCIALILGGAIGNLVDSTFYGVFLGLQTDGSTTPWFHGEVIDMFYVDIWKGTIPHWVPLIGGSMTALWPIFNVADSAIFVGVLLILLNQKRFFAQEPEQKATTGSTNISSAATTRNAPDFPESTDVEAEHRREI